VTEALIERFFGLKPPGSMTLTATLRLPVKRDTVTLDDARGVESRLRELVYHPERSLENDSDREAATLVAAKRRWVETPQTPANAHERCRAIREINARLQPYVSAERQALIDRRQQVATALRTKSILASREYAFCLYPAESLRRLMGLK
jgi:hypothetical protein